MKKSILIFISAIITSQVFGQSVEKIGGVPASEVSMVGSVPLSSAGSLGKASIVILYKNCKEIKNADPGAADGIYIVDPDGSGAIEPFNCYCDMTTNGGGWTMVGYYRNPATENAPPDLDNRDYAYFMKARSNEFYGKSEYIADPNSVGAWTDWRILSGVVWPLEFAVILDQASWSSGWEDYNAKVVYRVSSRDIMPNYGTSQDLVSGSNLYYKVNFSGGWIDTGSASSSDYYYWYPYSSANTYLITFHISNYAYKGDVATDYHYGAYYGQGIPGGNNTWYHSARLLVR